MKLSIRTFAILAALLSFVSVLPTLHAQSQDAPEKGPPDDPDAQDERNHDEPKGGETDGEGDPIDASSGAFSFNKRVFKLPGRGLDVELDIGYLSSAWGIGTNTGARWMHSYEEYLLLQYTWGNPIEPYPGPADVINYTPPDPNPEGGGGGAAPTVPLRPLYIDVYHVHDHRIDYYGRDPQDVANWIPQGGGFTKLRSQNHYSGPYSLPDSFWLRQPDGTVTAFPVALREGGCGVYMIRAGSIRDRNGNTIQIEYETVPKPGVCPFGEGTFFRRVQHVRDTLGRTLDFSYGTDGWLQTIQDFTGRQVHLEHDTIGNLTAIVAPTVTTFASETAQAPFSPRTEFEYSPRVINVPDSGHNVLRIFAPNEVAAGVVDPTKRLPYVQNTWDLTDPAGKRVVRQVYGGTNASGTSAGGVLDFIYEEQPTPVSHTWFSEGSRTLIVDRNGFARLYLFDPSRRQALKYCFTGALDHASIDPAAPPLISSLAQFAPSTPSASDALIAPPVAPLGSHAPRIGCVWEKSIYDANSLVVRQETPNEIFEFVYDSQSPDRAQRANLLVTKRISTINAADVLIQATLCEPYFNQPRLTADPRQFANDPPPNGTSSSPLRYCAQRYFDYQEGAFTAIQTDTQFWGIEWTQATALGVLAQYGLTANALAFNLPDLNADGTSGGVGGNVVRIDQVVNEFADPSQSPPQFSTRTVRTMMQYNAFGLPTRVIDPDGYATNFSYYAASSPAGQPGSASSASGGGFLAVVERQIAASTVTQEAYGYDAAGRIDACHNARGFATAVVLNQADHPAFTTDELGTRTLFVYDANGNTLEEWRELREPTFSSSTELPTGGWTPTRFVKTKLVYDMLDNLVERRVPVDSVGTEARVRYRYDRNESRVLTLYPEWDNDHANVLASVFDELANIYTTTHGGITSEFNALPWNADIAERAQIPISVSGLTATEKSQYSSWQEVYRYDGEGHKTTFEYDGFGRRIRTRDPLGNTTEVDTDRSGREVRERRFGQTTSGPVLLSQVESLRDELGRVFELRRLHSDSSGNPIGDGVSTTRRMYDGREHVVKTLDDGGNPTTFDYDGAGRLIKVVAPSGDVENLRYDASGNLIYKQTHAVASDNPLVSQDFETWFFHDAGDRLVAQVDGQGGATRFLHDTLGRVVFTSDAKGATVATPIASLDDPVHPQHASLPALLVNDHGNTARFAHDDGGYVLSTTRHMRRGGVGMAGLQSGGAGRIVTSRQYDLNGRLIAEFDDSSNATVTAYDALNRRVLRRLADQTTLQLEYYRNGNLKRSTDARGSIVEFGYDLANRLTTRTVTPGAGVGGNLTDVFEYDGMGRVTRAVNNSAVVVREYDSLSNPTREVLNGKSVTSAYDGRGLATSISYPGGRSLARVFDAVGRLGEVRDSGATSPLVEFEHLGRWRERSRAFGNGRTNRITYDVVGRVLGQVLADSATGTSVLDSRQNTWDRAGNKTQQKDAFVVPNRTRDYLYDSTYQMTRSTRKLGATLEEQVSYTLDDVGSRTSVTGGVDAGAYSATGSDSPMNRYTSTPADTRTYDPNGNQTARVGVSAAEYDAYNQMIAYTDTATSRRDEYAYDSFGRRISKVVDALGPAPLVTKYFYDAGIRIVEEQTASGSTLATYVYGSEMSELCSMRRDADGVPGAEDYFVHQDDLGNVVALMDSAGGIVERFEYSDFGRLVNSTYSGIAGSSRGLPFFYGAQVLDAETGLYQCRARYLDPRVGRFTTRDPIGTWGDGANLGNAYTYCGNNPWSRVDPLGLQGDTSNPLTDGPKGDCRNSENSGDEIRGDTEHHGSASGKEGKSGERLSDEEYQKAKEEKAKAKAAELQARVEQINKDFKEIHEKMGPSKSNLGNASVKVEAEAGKVKLTATLGKNTSVQYFDAANADDMKQLEKTMQAVESEIQGAKVVAGIVKAGEAGAEIGVAVMGAKILDKAAGMLKGLGSALGKLGSIFRKSEKFEKLLDGAGGLLKKFTIDAGGKSFYVPESATKHFVELMSGKLKMSPEAIAKSFTSAVEKLGATKFEYGKKVMVDGWEFVVEKGTGGPLDCIIHAVFKNTP